MPTPLYKEDIIPAQNRAEITTMADADIFVVSKDKALKRIAKTNVKETLGINANTTDIASNEARIDTAEYDITQLELDLADAELGIANNESAIETLGNNLQSYDTVSYATPNYVGGRLLETKNDVYRMGIELLQKAFKLAYASNFLKIYIDLGSGYKVGQMSFNGVTGNIEIVVDEVTYTYSMDDSTVLSTQTYLRAYHGLLKGTESYIDLRYDLPPSIAIFDGSNPRNILRESGGTKYLANLKDIVNTNDATQATETSQPSVDENGIISFDGVNDYMLTGAISEITGPFSFGVNSRGSNGQLFGFYANSTNKLDLSRGRLFLKAGSTVGQSLFATLDDSPTRYILTFDGVNFRFFKNGVEQTLSAYIGTISFLGMHLVAGSSDIAGAPVVKTIFKKAYLANYALSTEQIQQLDEVMQNE